MIIDAHHHLWKYNGAEYGWMDPSMEVLKRDYLGNELESEMAKAGVNGSVVVQARQKLEETTWLLEQAEEASFILGVVGWFDLRAENLRSRLDQYAGHSKLVGVRHVIHDEPDDDFMLRPAFLKGVEQLQPYDLVYDLLLFPNHLGRACRLAALFPEQRFVLDHLAKPPIRNGTLQPWADNIKALAARPNVWCKVSGMVTEADRNRWRYEDFVPYLEIVLDAFGTGRLMLGSDWPVCRLAAEYPEVMHIPTRFFGSMEAEDQRKIYMLNAMECYQLNR